MHVDVDEAWNDEMILQVEALGAGGSGPDTGHDVRDAIALEYECARTLDTVWKYEIRP